MKRPRLIANVRPLGRRRWRWEVKYFRADVLAYGTFTGNRQEAQQVARHHKKEMADHGN